MVCRYTPGLTVRTSTLLTQTVCWWLLLPGIHAITAEVAVTLVARTAVGARGTSLPISMVQAASREVRRLGVTERTLMRCGCRGGTRFRDWNGAELELEIRLV